MCVDLRPRIPGDDEVDIGMAWKIAGGGVDQQRGTLVLCEQPEVDNNARAGRDSESLTDRAPASAGCHRIESSKVNGIGYVTNSRRIESAAFEIAPRRDTARDNRVRDPIDPPFDPSKEAFAQAMLANESVIEHLFS